MVRINNEKLYIKQCYCLKCRKNTENKYSNVVRTKSGGIMLLLKCAACNSKKSKFLKEQEVRGLLGDLTGLKVPVQSHLLIANILL